MSSFLVLNGQIPGVLGQRQPGNSGRTSLTENDEVCRQTRREIGAEVECTPSNREGLLIDTVHSPKDPFSDSLASAGAHSHSPVMLGHICGVGLSGDATAVRALAEYCEERC